MDQTYESRDRAREQGDEDRCEAELHLRLCARRLPTGHLQFGWRVEHLDYGTTDGESLSGHFGPFQLPHECGQEVAAVVRTWMKSTTRKFYDDSTMSLEHGEGEQLTLRDFLAD